MATEFSRAAASCRRDHETKNPGANSPTIASSRYLGVHTLRKYLDCLLIGSGANKSYLAYAQTNINKGHRDQQQQLYKKHDGWLAWRVPFKKSPLRTRLGK